jgi:hypothetical protein
MMPHDPAVKLAQGHGSCFARLTVRHLISAGTGSAVGGARLYLTTVDDGTVATPRQLLSNSAFATV